MQIFYILVKISTAISEARRSRDQPAWLSDDSRVKHRYSMPWLEWALWCIEPITLMEFFHSLLQRISMVQRFFSFYSDFIVTNSWLLSRNVPHFPDFTPLKKLNPVIHKICKIDKYDVIRYGNDSEWLAGGVFITELVIYFGDRKSKTRHSTIPLLWQPWKVTDFTRTRRNKSQFQCDKPHND